MNEQEAEDLKAEMEVVDEEELEEIREAIEELRRFSDKIDKFLRGKFNEEWDSYEVQQK